jgi:putative ABC transport system ATP-binding protein
MMAGLLRPDAGRVVVDGTDLGTLSDGDRDAFRSRRIGYLIQGDFFLDSLNVIENVMIGMTLAGMDAKGHGQRARMLLDRVGLGDRAFHSTSVLSGGEGVRLALARALAADPPLLLADEPTASLDSVNARRIADLLDSLARDEGRTLVVATHDRDLFTPDAVLELPFVHGGGDSP